MIEHGFLDRGTPAPRVRDLLRAKTDETPAFVTVSSHQKVAEAISADGALLDLAAARRPRR